MSNVPQFTPEEIEKAKLYTEHVIHEIEMALIGEIEKIEGRVPLPFEIHSYGMQRWHKDMSSEYFWKGIRLVKCEVHQTDESGQRGTRLTIYQQPEGIEK